MSVFYDHLVGLDEIHNEILELNLPTRKHYSLLQIVDSTLHHEILNIILLEIPIGVHEQFLIEFRNSPDKTSHLDFIRLFSPHIEEKIRASASTTKAKLLEEIRKVK